MARFDIFQNQEVQAFAAGETIFRQGDPRTFMFVVNEGEVEIVVGNETVEVVQPGGISGEMAMIDGSPRTTAVARSDCRLVPIDAKRFQFLVHKRPISRLK